MRSKVITCPAGHAEYFEPGQVVEFDPEDCAACKFRGQCTHSMSGRGRTVQISQDEKLQHRLRKLQTTRNGRERLRKRTGIEHRLSHIAARKGPKARYKGVRKNLFDRKRSPGYCSLVTTAATSSRKTGLRPRAGSSSTGSTILAGPAGALVFTGELAAALFGT